MWWALDGVSGRPDNPAMSNSPRVLFVCLGNICRSPLAEGVFRAKAAARGVDVDVDSCGTGAWHVGNPPDPRSVATAAKNGLDISRQRARQLAPADYTGFDWIVAMDRDNEATIRQRAPATQTARCVRLMDYVDGHGDDVPDPYYGGPGGFDHVYRLLVEGTDGLLDDVVAAS